MNDMSQVIIPKSDQWNADDFIAGPQTFTISEVRISPGSEQPVSIVLEGTDKFYRPCKSMSRVLVQAWGANAKAYVGRSLTLYRDPSVKWAGLEIGGIRISHLSNIDGEKQMMLTATKGSRKPFKVLPLVMQKAPAQNDAAAKWATAYVQKLDTFTDLAAVEAFEAEKSKKLAELETARPELHATVTAALASRKAAFAGSFDDDLTDPPHDATTGEISEPYPDERQVEPDTNVNDVAQAAADAIIAEIEAPECNAEMDVKAVLSRREADIAALPDDQQTRVEIAVSRRRAAIEAEREAAKVTA